MAAVGPHDACGGEMGSSPPSLVPVESSSVNVLCVRLPWPTHWRVGQTYLGGSEGKTHIRY